MKMSLKKCTYSSLFCGIVPGCISCRVQYLLYSMLLVLISCAVFQMIIRYSSPAFYFAFKGTISWAFGDRMVRDRPEEELRLIFKSFPSQQSN